MGSVLGITDSQRPRASVSHFHKTLTTTPMADKKKNPKLNLPKGRLQYPRLIGKPDTKFNADGEWKTAWVGDLNDPKVQKIRDQLDTFHAAAIEAEKKNQTEKAEKGKKVNVKAGDPPYTVDEEANTITVRAKLKVKGESKKTGETWTNAVAVFGPDGKPLPATARIGGGSVAQVQVEVQNYYVAASKTAGASLKLRAVLISELHEYGGDAASFGFDMAENDTDSEDAVETSEAVTAEESDF